MEQSKYEELHIKIEPKNQKAFIEAIDGNLSVGWRRVPEKELRLAVSNKRYYYVCDDTPGRTGALLSIYPKGEDTLYVSNVVPKQPNKELSAKEYNSVLRDFHDRVIASVKTRIPFVLHMKEASALQSRELDNNDPC